MPLLSRDEVAKLATAEVAYSRSKAETERLKDNRDAVRAEVGYARLPLGEYVELFGVMLRRREGSTGEKFSLSRMRAAGKRLPKYLLPFASESKPTKLLDVKPAPDQPQALVVLAERVAELDAAARTTA